MRHPLNLRFPVTCQDDSAPQALSLSDDDGDDNWRHTGVVGNPRRDKHGHSVYQAQPQSATDLQLNNGESDEIASPEEETIGQRLRRIMNERHYSLRRLGKATGVQHASIQGYINRNSVPDEWLIRACKVLEVSPIMIRYGIDPRPFDRDLWKRSQILVMSMIHKHRPRVSIDDIPKEKLAEMFIGAYTLASAPDRQIFPEGEIGTLIRLSLS